jgi:gas vesicle protein
MRAEIGEGLDHLRLATAHGAGEVSEAVAPRLRAAREQALVPLVAAAHVGAAEAARLSTVASEKTHALSDKAVALSDRAIALSTKTRKKAKKTAKAARKQALRTEESRMPRKRKTFLVGLLAAGAAAGVAGALVARRRSRARWDEYDSQGGVTGSGDAHSFGDTLASSAHRAGEKAAEWSSSASQTAHEWAHSAKETLSGKAATVTDAVAEKADEAADVAEHLSEHSSKNGRS